PSRVRAFIPHPAGHSRHVVVYQVSTLAISCSEAVTGEARLSEFGVFRHPVEPATVPARPPSPTSLRKSRRSSESVILLSQPVCLLMTRVALPRGATLLMTLKTPTHC